ncbi:hypothetical protein CCUS01_06515 [Colletotrichum cuscutae]|uniref:Uncharacterized protein n=1 Tax=Colletotrichum cuscutae TaxID=1209917 RepID=A0AAI9V4I9_9PEZI|nr:hypothetical protein CCUS01_06515 [Colletotrichum cuscutae]
MSRTGSRAENWTWSWEAGANACPTKSLDHTLPWGRHDPNSAGLVASLQSYKSYEDFTGQAPTADGHLDSDLIAPETEVTAANSHEAIEQLPSLPADSVQPN